jgi:hypothetical protein
MRPRRFLTLTIALSAALSLAQVTIATAAQFFEVRRDATLYDKASRHSDKVMTIRLAEHARPYLVRAVPDETRRNGYYRVELRDGKKGWIYQSFVRAQPSTVGGIQRAYKRSLYRHWIDDDGDCQDTRVEVLIRDSDARALSLRGPNNCIVRGGKWSDPYSGQTFRNPRGLDVDHVVPLKNAHESGAWAWTAEKRREYANYLKYEQHLLAVKASENRKKGDKGPDRYLPPQAEYHCEYVRVWTKIKTEWSLEIPSSERQAIDRVRVSC